MMHIIFTVCLISDPSQCETRDLQVYENMSVYACAMGAPAQLAQWRENHPDWRITRWSCGGGQRQAKR